MKGEQLVFGFYEDLKSRILKHEKMIEKERNPQINVNNNDNKMSLVEKEK